MKAKKRIAVFLTIVLSIVLFSVAANADFGDYGGDSDYGGGWDSDWDSGWDSGDSWDWDDDDDDDYRWYGGSSGGYSGTSSGSSSVSLDEPGAMILGAIVLLAIIVGVCYVVIRIIRGPKKKNGGKKQALMPGATPTSAASLTPMIKYNEVDPDFSAEALREQISNRYVQFQNAWEEKDLSSLRPYMTDAFYAQMDRQLDNNYRKKQHTNHIERIAVLGVDLVGWRRSGPNDEIIARLRTRIVDYVTLDATGTVIRGSKNAEKFMEYEWSLVRASGVKTQSAQQLTVHNCPNCGAVLNINHTAKCEYCGSIVTVEAHEWAVSGIKGLSQRTQK